MSEDERERETRPDRLSDRELAERIAVLRERFAAWPDDRKRGAVARLRGMVAQLRVVRR